MEHSIINLKKGFGRDKPVRILFSQGDLSYSTRQQATQ